MLLLARLAKPSDSRPDQYRHQQLQQRHPHTITTRRYWWIALEKSVSEIVGVLSPTQSDVVYLAYGFAILALPFMF